MRARQKAFAALATAGALIALLVYWADGMLISFLVYVAISGVEVAQPPRFLSPEMNESSLLRMQRFAWGGIVGLSLAIATALLIAALVRWWNKPRLRWTILVVLAAGLAAECGTAAWIGGPGLRQLSRPMQEATGLLPLGTTLLAGAMVLLAVGAFTWRLLARAARVDPSLVSSRPPVYLHEHWLGCLLVGVVVSAQGVIGVIASAQESIRWRGGPTDWDVFAYGLTHPPTAFIWLAALLGGFALAWVHWRRRNAPAESLVPSVNPAEFCVLLAVLLIALVASAPIVAAVGLSYWFLDAGVF